MTKFIGFAVLAFWVVGGLLLTPGVSFAQAALGIQIFDDDSRTPGISVVLSGGGYLNSNLVITQETAAGLGSVIWNFDFPSFGAPATFSYNIYEFGTNLQNPPASALSDTLQFTRSAGPVPGLEHGLLQFFSGPLDEANNALLSPLPNATAITETGALQTPPNPPPEFLLGFQFQSDLDAPTSVPEPVSLLLFGFGLVGMAVIGRETRKEKH